MNNMFMVQFRVVGANDSQEMHSITIRASHKTAIELSKVMSEEVLKVIKRNQKEKDNE